MIGDYTALTLIGLVLASVMVRTITQNLISDPDSVLGQLFGLMSLVLCTSIGAMVGVSILEALEYIQGDMAWLIVLF